ncbi:MAG: thymidylate synthase [Oscillospiraceae bacterium]|nr:thymidylate synthase [Oscillospiraceae bacterium]
MSMWDDEYVRLLKKIRADGTEVENRTGVSSIKIPSWHFSLDIGEEFPILTTKQLFIRQAVLEMLWIYQAQSNDVRWLKARNVNIWNEWEIDDDGFWTATQMVPDGEGGLVKKEIKKEFGKEWAHTIGTAYGWIVHKFGLTNELISKLKTNQTDRRMVMSLWQNDYLETAVLPSCVWSSEWDVTDGKLNAWVHQRSCDVPLGLPFNVTQYSVLLCMLAQVTGLKPGTIDWSIKDAHIYVNQVSGVDEQIRRYDENGGGYPAPKLWLNPDVDDFYKFDNSAELKDVKLIDYRHMGKIAFPIAQ